jgi:hypothetical protein
MICLFFDVFFNHRTLCLKQAMRNRRLGVVCSGGATSLAAMPIILVHTANLAIKRMLNRALNATMFLLRVRGTNQLLHLRPVATN